MTDLPQVPISSETAKIRKALTFLTNDYYNTLKTSLLLFHFEPAPFLSSHLRMQKSSIKYASVEGKDLYLFDGFFQKNEGEMMREFSAKTSFSRNSYGSPESIEKGEKPARSMNGKERWQFFSNPPQPMHEVYKLLALLGYHLDAEVSTLPWELCDQTTGSPSVIANFIEEASEESMEFGKHQDSNPEKGIAFGIPILYAKEKKFYPSQFINGDRGNPWLVSLMLYSTSDTFLREYAMGTAFYKTDGQIALKTDCLDMRLVLFEGDIFHTIDASKIPLGKKEWRVSYVFKLLINPKKKGQSMKKAFSNWVKSLGLKIDKIPLGINTRA